MRSRNFFVTISDDKALRLAADCEALGVVILELEKIKASSGGMGDSREGSDVTRQHPPQVWLRKPQGVRIREMKISKRKLRRF